MDFNWSPGIGDPTIGGWVTVALYLLASFSCWTSARKIRLKDARCLQERRAWRCISALFLALGINKQLDLQTALTETGRVLAHYQGWYAQRQLVQLAFIALVAMTCFVAALFWSYHDLRVERDSIQGQLDDDAAPAAVSVSSHPA